MKYDRTIVGYHGCDEETAAALLRGEPFRPSDNDFDWLGKGVYFWEFGPNRALRFAQWQRERGKVQDPAVVGAMLQLGAGCFDLMDTHYTEQLATAYNLFHKLHGGLNLQMPKNSGSTPDRKLRRLDCAVINFWLDFTERSSGVRYDSVRCAFGEGGPVYPGARIHRESHIQVAIRNPACIIGVFRPTIPR